MLLREIVDILDATVICGDPGDDSGKIEIKTACGSDMMSDALAFVKDQALLLTGLLNPQVVRTADMLDMRCIVFVRGKQPGEDTVTLARERGIVLLSTSHRMFTACGRLYAAGLEGGGE